MAQSLMLSDAYYDEETDHKPSKQKLHEASRRIRSGVTIEWDEKVLDKLSKEQKILERAGSPGWFRIIVFLIALFLLLSVPVALVVAVLVIIRRLM